MKRLKLAIVIALLFSFGMTGNSQTVIKLTGGVFYESSGASSALFPLRTTLRNGNGSIGIGFERVKADRYSTQANLMVDFLQMNPTFRWRQDFRFYVTDDAPSGLYLGPYLTIGITASKIEPSPTVDTEWQFLGLSGLGANVGYQVLLADDKLAIDVNLAPGFLGTHQWTTLGANIYEYEFKAGFNLMATVSVGIVID